MDKGAHFHNCDFQVHSPRDHNWSGKRPVSYEERKLYAGHCQRKVEYFARTPTSYFAAIDFPRFFQIDPRGSMTTSSIQNFPLTMPPLAHNVRFAANSGHNKYQAPWVGLIVTTLSEFSFRAIATAIRSPTTSLASLS